MLASRLPRPPILGVHARNVRRFSSLPSSSVFSTIRANTQLRWTPSNPHRLFSTTNQANTGQTKEQLSNIQSNNSDNTKHDSKQESDDNSKNDSKQENEEYERKYRNISPEEVDYIFYCEERELRRKKNAKIVLALLGCLLFLWREDIYFSLKALLKSKDDDNNNSHNVNSTFSRKVSRLEGNDFIESTQEQSQSSTDQQILSSEDAKPEQTPEQLQAEQEMKAAYEESMTSLQAQVDQLTLQLNKQYQTLATDMHAKSDELVSVEKASIDSRYDDSLREQKIRVLLELEGQYSKQLEEAMDKIQEKFNDMLQEDRANRITDLANLHCELSATEKFLASRKESEELNQKVHRLTLTVLQLDDLFGHIDGRSSIEKVDVNSFAAIMKDLNDIDSKDPVVQTAIRSIPSVVVEDGIAPVSLLQSEWKPVMKKGLQAAYTPPGGGLWGMVLGKVFSAATVAEVALIEGNTDQARLSRAAYHVSNVHLQDAFQELNQLSEHVRVEPVVQEWMEALHHRLVIQQAVQLIKARLLTTSSSRD